MYQWSLIQVKNKSIYSEKIIETIHAHYPFTLILKHLLGLFKWLRFSLWTNDKYNKRTNTFFTRKTIPLKVAVNSYNWTLKL